MSRHMTVLSGLPRSGKTFKAMEILRENPKAVRLNKDELRETLHKGLLASGSRENNIVSVHNVILTHLLKKNCNDIILDDLNLNPKHIERYENLSLKYGYEIDVIKIDTPVCICIDRDSKMPKPLGRDYIINMAHKYHIIEQELGFVIYDVNGTIFDITARKMTATTGSGEVIPEILNEPEMFTTDVVRDDILQMLLNDHEAGFEIILISDSPESTRKALEKQLQKYSIPYSRLLMRQDGDESPEYQVKRKILNTYLDKSMCCRVIDDSMFSLHMWREEGIHVSDVALEMAI